MKRFALLAAVATLAAGPVAAQDKGPMMTLAGSKNCMACHAVDKKLIGPGYNEVAAKYKGKADVIAKLPEKVKAGGVGAWGQVPMPANNVTPDEAKKLVDWIMAGADPKK